MHAYISAPVLDYQASRPRANFYDGSAYQVEIMRAERTSKSFVSNFLQFDCEGAAVAIKLNRFLLMAVEQFSPVFQVKISKNQAGKNRKFFELFNR